MRCGARWAGRIASVPTWPHCSRDWTRPAPHRRCCARAGTALLLAADLATRTVASGQEHRFRQAASALYHASTAALMVWEGALLAGTRGDARRWLWAKLVLDERLSAKDPLSPDGDAAHEQRVLDLLQARADAATVAAALAE